jgi:hypothetical protein
VVEDRHELGLVVEQEVAMVEVALVAQVAEALEIGLVHEMLEQALELRLAAWSTKCWSRPWNCAWLSGALAGTAAGAADAEAKKRSPAARRRAALGS